MKTTALAVLAGLAIGFSGSVASAHPTDYKKQVLKRHTGKLMVSEVVKDDQEVIQAADFFDNFDSYVAGSDIVGQGGWELWYTGGQSAIVSDDTANSGKNSLKDHVLSDIVQRFNISDGQWVLSVMTFCPSNPVQAGEGYIIMMSGYGDPAVDQWNLQIRLDSSAFQIVEVQFGLATTPIILDEWVEFRAEIDLDADAVTLFYDNVLLWEGAYTAGVNGTGSTDIACLDLFSNSVDPIYFDDVSLTAAGGGCYADCNEDTILDFFDFLCYLNAFDNEDAYADCEANGIFDFFDFLCYLNEFDGGC
jgi:hypothetical protein